jgi:hypothetical protein
MAITINWATKVINVPKADMTLIQSNPTEIRELNQNQFRLNLKSIEASEEGAPHIDTHRHNTTVDVGGITLARVVEIINGYTVTFEDGQYAVNLTGANSNVADVVNVNQVSVRSGNSAGLVTSAGIEAIEYEQQVCIDTVNGESGSVYPIGTYRRPVDNITDALLICTVRGFSTILFLNDFTITGSVNIDGFTLKGSSLTTNIVLDPSASCVNIIVNNATVTGTLDGNAHINNCSIGTLNYVSGEIHDCGLFGTITLGGSDEAVIQGCYTIDQDNPPVINMGGSGQDLSMPNYSGLVTITNLSSASEEVGIGLDSGLVTLASSVSAGTIIVAGVGTLTDNSTGTATVDSSGLVNPGIIAESVWAYER